MMKQLIFAFAIIFYGTISKGQLIDSLQKELSRARGSQRIMLLNELCYQLMYDAPTEAIQFGSQAVMEARLQSDSLLLAQAINDLSMPYLVTGNFDTAILLNNQAYALRMKYLKPGLAAANLAKIGQAWYEKGNYYQSMLHQAKAYYILVQIKDSSRLAAMCNNLGVLFEKQKVFQEAMRWYQSAANYAIATNDERSFYLAKVNQAILNRKTKHYAEAEKIFDSCRTYFETKAHANEKTKYFEALGVLYRETGRSDKGAAYYQKALEEYQQQADEVGMCNSFKNLSYCYKDMKQPKLQWECLNKSLALAEKNQLQEILQDLHLDLYDYYKQANQIPRALYHLELHQAIKDSVFNLASSKLAEEYSARFQVERHKSLALEKEKQLLTADLSLKKKNLQLFLLAAVASLILVALIGFLFYYKERRIKLMQRAALQMNEERLRISRDLHDNLGADITWIAAELDMASYQEPNHQFKSRLEEMADKMRMAMLSLRETIWAIHQNQASLEELMLKLKENSKAALAAKSIMLQLPEAIPDVMLSPAQTLHVYRILKEALNNVIKYAGTEQCVIEAALNNNTLQLSLVDFGVGFDPKTTSNGYGLNNMKQRAKENQIDFTLEASPGKGTRITLLFKPASLA